MPTLESCFRLADERSDENDTVASSHLHFAAATAETYRKKLSRLAWACTYSNAKKRDDVLQIVLAELYNSDTNMIGFPMRKR